MRLGEPEMYMATRDNMGRIPTLTKQMEAANDHLRRIATLGHMLAKVNGPLQHVAGLHPSQARNST